MNRIRGLALKRWCCLPAAMLIILSGSMLTGSDDTAIPPLSLALGSSIVQPYPQLTITPIVPSSELEWSPRPFSRSSHAPGLKTDIPDSTAPILSENLAAWYEKLDRREQLEQSLFNASTWALIALNAADFVSTRKALRYDCLVEGNPLMKPFTKNDLTFAAVKAGITVGNHFLMKSLYRHNKRTAWFVSLFSNFIMSYIVVNNFRMIQKAQGIR